MRTQSSSQNPSIAFQAGVAVARFDDRAARFARGLANKIGDKAESACAFLKDETRRYRSDGVIEAALAPVGAIPVLGIVPQTIGTCYLLNPGGAGEVAANRLGFTAVLQFFLGIAAIANDSLVPLYIAGACALPCVVTGLHKAIRGPKT